MIFYNENLEIMLSAGSFVVFLSSYSIIEKMNLYKVLLFFIDLA